MSGAAEKMRAEIERMVAEGRTERQVIDFYKAQYGMRILREPEGVTWWAATLVPGAALVFGLAVLVRFLRNTRRDSQ